MGWRPPLPWVAAFLRATQPLLHSVTLLSTVTLLRVLVGWGGRCAGTQGGPRAGLWGGESDEEGHYHGSALGGGGGVAASSASNVSSVDGSIDSLDEEGLPPLHAAAGQPPSFFIPQPWLDTAAHVVEGCSQLILAAPTAAVRARSGTSPAAAAQAAAAAGASVPPPPAAGAPPQPPPQSAAAATAGAESSAPGVSNATLSAAGGAAHADASLAGTQGQPQSAAHIQQLQHPNIAGQRVTQHTSHSPLPLGLQALAPSPPFRCAF